MGTIHGTVATNLREKEELSISKACHNNVGQPGKLAGIIHDPA